MINGKHLFCRWCGFLTPTIILIIHIFSYILLVILENTKKRNNILFLIVSYTHLLCHPFYSSCYLILPYLLSSFVFSLTVFFMVIFFAIILFIVNYSLFDLLNSLEIIFWLCSYDMIC